MQLVKDTYNERVSDIEAHFELIRNISDAIGSGGAKFLVNDNYYAVTIQQQKILFSSTYLQLYNLVESTVNQLLSAIGRHSERGISDDLTKLSDKIRDLYLKHMIPPEDNLTPEKRLERALKLLDQAVGREPVKITIPRGGGGNWDMVAISKLNNRVGVELILPRTVEEKLRRPFRNEQGPLRYIKEVRNSLGHGSVSFAECGKGHAYSEFRILIDIVKDYLSHLMNAYENYINNEHYLSHV
ncbi:MAE_28990/MAE_18760 family HEPN-like nuclease [Marinomonas sp. PE14-40]|uniref:MAE_28990/MAE_18760 family HEPN-like nuclease n=1 Tax=Marinomonas sp. PE14-40 TaxID=3060621 RepID=UPI003F669144